jgi:hypothetical protein
MSLRAWRIAPLLLTTHLPFLMLLWVPFVLIVAVLTVGVATFGTITASVWDPAAMFLRWVALGYGLYLTNGLLPMYVAHGQTRRAFLVQVAVFLVVTAAVLAVLVGVGYFLEGILYRAMDWPQAVRPNRAFSSPGQFPLVFAAYWVMFLVWTFTGAFLAAAFYRPGGWGVVAAPLALVLVSASGLAFGLNGLPFVGRFLDAAEVSRPLSLALSGGSLLLGLAMTWVIVRDIPIRNRTA